MASTMRSHILNVASELFATRGINATGVDTIVSSAGIAKMTLYKYFKSKEQLIVEYLQQHDARLRQGLFDRIGDAKPGATQLRELVNAVMEWISDPEFKGFAFINASIEFPQSESTVHQVSVEFAQALRSTIAASAKQSGVKKPEILALQLSLLIEGAAMAEQMQRGSGAIQHAREAADTLIKAALA
jgi:AcrR family transcriptional regulator